MAVGVGDFWEVGVLGFLCYNVLHMDQPTITLRLPKKIKKRLDSFVKSEQRNRSEVVRDALRQYFAKEEFRALRAKMVPRAQGRGVFTDDDVFDRVS